MTVPLTRRPAVPHASDILLVEDNPLEVELILRPLSELVAAIRIDVAGDGEQALDILLPRGGFRHQLGAPLPRLILLDLKLPRLDGIEVIRGLRGNSRTSVASIVVLTSTTDPRQLAQCYQAGANSCVQKPVRYEEFSRTIQSVARYWLELNQALPPMAMLAT